MLLHLGKLTRSLNPLSHKGFHVSTTLLHLFF
nr:MAG TPA: hypothetical protein [Bacteriophage sp.]